MIEIIPAMDLSNGRCVRLEQGDFRKEKSYSANPLEMALYWESYGFKRLHLVDLDGARMGRVVHADVLKQIKSATRLLVDFSGGLRTDADVKMALDAGADMIAVGSVAVHSPELLRTWFEKYGAGRVILSADSRGGSVATEGWLRQSDCPLTDFISGWAGKGIGTVICTDIDRDGTLQGIDPGFYAGLRSAFPALRLIASGGVRSLDDVERLDVLGLNGVIAGKALYENTISLPGLKKYILRTT